MFRDQEPAERGRGREWCCDDDESVPDLKSSLERSSLTEHRGWALRDEDEAFVDQRRVDDICQPSQDDEMSSLELQEASLVSCLSDERVDLTVRVSAVEGLMPSLLLAIIAGRGKQK